MNSPQIEHTNNGNQHRVGIQLRGENIDDRMEALLDILHHCSEVDLERCRVSNEHASIIVEKLAGNEYLKVLRIADNYFLSESGARQIATHLCPSLLVELLLNGNSLQDMGALAISSLLPQLHKLHTLNVSHNHIGNVGAIAIARQAHRLRILDVSNNSISDDGAQAMAQLVAASNHLERLYLNSNVITIGGMEAIARSLIENKSSLRELRVDSNPIGDDGIVLLAQALRRSKSIQRVHLGQRRMTNTGIVELCDALKDNSSIQYINCRSFSNDNDTADCIIDALHYNDTLLEIEFDTVRVDQVKQTQIARFLHDNQLGLRREATAFQRTRRTIEAVWRPLVIDRQFDIDSQLWGTILGKAATNKSLLYLCLREAQGGWVTSAK